MSSALQQEVAVLVKSACWPHVEVISSREKESVDSIAWVMAFITS
jgi:hypothetical protein